MLDGPLVIDRFLGQTAATDRLRAAIDLAFLRDEPLEPTLIVAPSGAGGSYLARIVAAELGSPIATIDVGGFESVAGQVADLADGLTRHDVLIVTNIERAHMRQAQELAGLIRRGCVVASWQDPPIPPGLKIGVPPVSIVATTTSRPSPQNRLLRMFPRTVCLEPYDAKAMRRILSGAAKRMRAGATRGALDWLAGTCERRPGAAVELLATASDLAWRHGHDRVQLDDARRAFVLEGVDRLGEPLMTEAFLSTLGVLGGEADRLDVIELLDWPEPAALQVERALLDRGVLQRCRGRMIRAIPPKNPQVDDGNCDGSPF